MKITHCMCVRENAIRHEMGTCRERARLRRVQVCATTLCRANTPLHPPACLSTAPSRIIQFLYLLPS
uniref:Uncharacterized protein n=1 Tax=Anguilla anguilla TaxID=7936 RepID=A0A0E9XNJ5_ANGAN